MPVSRNNRNNDGGFVSRNLTFFGMVGAVMAALRLKEKWDDYKQLPADEEGGLNGTGRVALHSPVGFRDEDDEDNITLNATAPDGLVNTEIPAASRPKRKRSRKCCMCCGINCGLFWKALGIVFSILFVWNAFKLIRWAITPSPTGLEGMPDYSSSLGCVDASYIKDDSPNAVYTVTPGFNYEHTLDIQGIAAGTVVIAQGAPDASEIKYEMTLRSNDQTSVKSFDVTHNSPPSAGSSDPSLLSIRTAPTKPSTSVSRLCMRYDVKLYVPPNLKKLNIKTRSVTHLRFDPESHIALDDLSVDLYTTNLGDATNIIEAHNNLRATRLALQVNKGWITGEVSIVNKTSIATQAGDAVTNLRVVPVPPVVDEETSSEPQTAYLETITGAGRTDIFYAGDKAYPHRPIDSTHSSLRKGELYLTYSDAEYNGYIDLRAQSYSARGVHGTFPLPKLPGLPSRPGSDVSEDDRAYHGDKDGGDKLTVKSPNGWVGLYF